MLICAEKFVENLKSKNLNYAVADTERGDTVVDFPYQGKVTKCIFSGEEGQYFSMYLVYERVPENKIPDVIFTCNELNCRYKWVTFYLDKDNDVVLHDDAILSLENAADEAFELLVRILRIGDDVKQPIMHAIFS